jgi:hypothetical protein
MRPDEAARDGDLSGLERAEIIAFSVREVGDGADARYDCRLDHLLSASHTDTALSLREILDLDGVDIASDGLAVDPAAAFGQRAVDPWLVFRTGRDQPVVDRGSFPAARSRSPHGSRNGRRDP